jgi:hypothetical protein
MVSPSDQAGVAIVAIEVARVEKKERLTVSKKYSSK